ncbi:MAG TPA: hypothetical protein VFN02_00185, partial [Ktedonobacteraceae bacterium]|nr:hypothetical protein [Ktedonobacteraceae bacterium]
PCKSHREHYVSAWTFLEQRMSLFLVSFGIPLDKSGDYTTITIIGLTGLRGLVGLTTGRIDASMAQGD